MNVDVRYVLISDYATMDHAGKLVVAGMYLEDIVVQQVPTIVSSLVFTVLAKSPASPVNLKMRLRAPSRAVVIEGDVTVGPSPDPEGRSVVGFQFAQLPLPEEGRYSMSFSEHGKDAEEIEIHNFRVLAGPIPSHLVPQQLKSSTV
jgi:hypothetical protein